MSLRRLLPDRFICALIATVLLASLLPCRGETARVFDWLTDAAIALLFFLHGAKLSRSAALAGLTAALAQVLRQSAQPSQPYK